MEMVITQIIPFVAKPPCFGSELLATQSFFRGMRVAEARIAKGGLMAKYIMGRFISEVALQIIHLKQ